MIYINIANVSSYTFENMSRIGNDSCYLDQESIQNNNALITYYKTISQMTVL